MADFTVPHRDMLLTAILEDANRLQAFVVEGRQVAREGEVLRYSILWTGFTSISIPTTTLYQGGTDISAGNLSGSELSNGNVQTLRVLTIPAGSGGTTFVLEATLGGLGVRSDSQTRKVGITIDILKPGAGG